MSDDEPPFQETANHAVMTSENPPLSPFFGEANITRSSSLRSLVDQVEDFDRIYERVRIKLDRALADCNRAVSVGEQFRRALIEPDLNRSRHLATDTPESTFIQVSKDELGKLRTLVLALCGAVLESPKNTEATSKSAYDDTNRSREFSASSDRTTLDTLDQGPAETISVPREQIYELFSTISRI